MNKYLLARRSMRPRGAFAGRLLKRATTAYNKLSPAQKALVGTGLDKGLRTTRDLIQRRMNRRYPTKKNPPGKLRNVEFVSNDTGAEITYSTYKMRKYKEPRNFKGLALRQYYYDTTDVDQNSINDRGFFALPSLNAEDIALLMMVARNETATNSKISDETFTVSGFVKPDQRYLIKGIKHRLTLTNLSNSSVNVKIHILSVKRDHGIDATTFSQVADPRAAFFQGLFPRSIDPNRTVFRDESQRLNIGLERSHTFARNYGIVKTIKVNLTPGQTHVHNAFREINYVMNYMDLYVKSNTSLADSNTVNMLRYVQNIRGVTQFFMVEYVPNPALTDGQSSMGLPSVRIGYTFTSTLSAKVNQESRAIFTGETSTFTAGTYVGTNPDTGALNQQKGSTT